MLNVPVDNQLPVADQSLKMTSVVTPATESTVQKAPEVLEEDDILYIEYGDPDEESHKLNFRDDAVDVFNSIRDHLSQIGSRLLDRWTFPRFMSYCERVRDVNKLSGHGHLENLAEDDDDVYVCHAPHY